MAKDKELVKKTTSPSMLNLGEWGEERAKKGEVIEGLESLSFSDLKIPKIKLLQPTSLEVTKKKLPAGNYYNSITEQHYEKLPCILLAMNKTRVKWRKPFKRGDEPLCRSFDAIKRFDGKLLCANCPDSKWNNDRDENTPICNMSYVWMGVIDDGVTNEEGIYLPGTYSQKFRLIAAGKSVEPTKNYLNVIVPQRLPLWVFRTVLTSEFVENEKGSFYVMKYSFQEENQTIPISLKEYFKGETEAILQLFVEAAKRDTMDTGSADYEIVPEKEDLSEEERIF